MKHVYRAVAGLIIAFLCIPASGQADAPPPAAKRVNINSADSSQLCMLPRVGPSLADRIVEYRKDNGPFKKPEDLMLVQGVGEKTFQLIKPYIATSGDTTLKEKAGSSRSGKSKGKSAKAKAGKSAKDKGTSPSSGGAGKAVRGKAVRPVSGTPPKAKKAPKAPKAAKSQSTRRPGAGGDGR